MTRFYNRFVLPAALLAGISFPAGCSQKPISSETRNGIEKAEYTEYTVFTDKKDPLLVLFYHELPMKKQRRF